MTKPEIWIDVALLAVALVALALALKNRRETERTKNMLESEMRRALELDVTHSYQELLEEHRKLRSGTC